MIRNGAAAGGEGGTNIGDSGGGGAMGGAVGGNDGCIYPDEVIMEKGVAFNVRVCIVSINKNNINYTCPLTILHCIWLQD